MAFNVSNEAFEKVFGNNKEKGKFTDDFMRQLIKFLEGKNYQSAIIIREWLKRGGTLSSFTCREDVLESLISEMRKHRIPFVMVNDAEGGIGFLIRTEDTEKIKKIQRRVLKKHSQYCAVATGENAGKVYLKSKGSDKLMLQICGLNEEEIIYLEDTCNETLPGETVGIDKMADGTYMFSCHGKSTVEGKKGRRSFGSSLTETIMVMNGSTAATMRKRAQDTAQFRLARASGFPDKDGESNGPVWVVGDGNRFVKSTGSGFELGYASEIGETVLLETSFSVAQDDSNYKGRLNSALAHIVGRKCLYTLSDVIMHFKTKKKYMKDQTITGEQLLIAQADAMIQEKIKKDSITHQDGRWDYKFKHYQHEMGELMKAVRDGKIPAGYTKENIIQLMNTGKAFSLNMELLTPAIEKLLQLEVYLHDAAAQEKVNDIDNQIAKFREHGGLAIGTDHDRSILDR